MELISYIFHKAAPDDVFIFSVVLDIENNNGFLFW